MLLNLLITLITCCPGRQYPEQNKPTRIQRIPSHAQDECHHRGGQLLHHPGGGLRPELLARRGVAQAGPVHQLHAGTNRLRHPLAHVQRREDILPGAYLNLDTLRVNPIPV